MRLLMQMRKKDRNSRKIFFRRKNGIGEGERIELQRDITK